MPYVLLFLIRFRYAKDMGIWSLALVLPQVVAGKVAGLIADNFKEGGKTTRFGYR